MEAGQSQQVGTHGGTAALRRGGGGLLRAQISLSAARASGSFRGGDGMFRSSAQKTQGLLTVGDTGCRPALSRPVLLSSPSLLFFFPSFT